MPVLQICSISTIFLLILIMTIQMIRRSCMLQITCRRNILPTGNIPFAIHKSLDFIMLLKLAIHYRFILMLQEKNPNRKPLVKLRNIERGRYDKISSCDRICPVCGLNIEDDIHYLFDCQKCSSTRDDFSIKLIIEFLITSTCQFRL